MTLKTLGFLAVFTAACNNASKEPVDTGIDWADLDADGSHQ